jgi:hypothetical protein
MGIFSEDLINLGNLIDTEIEVKVPKELLNETFKGLNFEVLDGLLRVGFKKKGFIFSKDVQVPLKEDAQSVKNEQPDIRAIGLTVMTEKGLEELLQKGPFKREGEHVFFNLWEAITKTEEYAKVPKQFKNRLLINRYKLKQGYIQLWVRVSKGL